MKEEKWNEAGRGANSARYIVMSLLAALLIAAGLLGYMSDRPRFGSLLGDYQEMMHGNWVLLLGIGILIGLTNLLLTFSRR